MKKILLFIFSVSGSMLFGQTLTMPSIPSSGVTYPVTIKADTVPHPSQGNWDFSNITTDATGTRDVDGAITELIREYDLTESVIESNNTDFSKYGTYEN